MARNAFIVIEDISKTFIEDVCFFFCDPKTLTYLTVFSCVYCCVQ